MFDTWGGDAPAAMYDDITCVVEQALSNPQQRAHKRLAGSQESGKQPWPGHAQQQQQVHAHRKTSHDEAPRSDPAITGLLISGTQHNTHAMWGVITEGKAEDPICSVSLLGDSSSQAVDPANRQSVTAQATQPVLPSLEPATTSGASTQFPAGRSRLIIPASLSKTWQLVPGMYAFQVEMDGVLGQQAPNAWQANLALTTMGLLRTVLPKEVCSLIADTYCCGWRKLQDGTLVLVMATHECSRLTVMQCLVSKWNY